MSIVTKSTPWQASWIWGGSEQSPRNEWRWFRTSFVCPSNGEALAKTVLWITADSRYEVYVNGTRVGRGPVRYYSTDIFYDGHEVGHLLRRGEINTIAVQVMHYGVSNFAYLRGRGGLLAQLDAVSGDGSEIALAKTGDNWKTSVHAGQDPAISRMSCQTAFAERIDGRQLADAWKSIGYSDAEWQQAEVIGPVGMEPWVRLHPRDIPYLTEEPVLPTRVISLNRVVPYRLTAFIDAYSLMKADGEENANHIRFCGAFATVLRLKEESEVKVMLHIGGLGIVRLGDKLYTGEELGGEPPLVCISARLPAGDHLLLYTVYGPEHGHSNRIGVDADQEIEWISPLSAEKAADSAEQMSPFVRIGPSFTYTCIDFVDQYDLLASWEAEKIRFADRVGSLSSVGELRDSGYAVDPVPHLLANGEDTFMPQFAKRESEAYSVPAGLQRIAVASSDPGVVPVFESGDTEFMLDFGKEWSGYLEFELEAEAGVTVDWYGIEYRKDAYVQHTYGVDNTLRYVTREGYQRYESPVRRGFRYLIVTVRDAKKPVLVHGVRFVQSNYPAPEIGVFQCSDDRLGRVWDISKHTTKLCMEDTFVDCPTYEQAFWVGDSRNEALVNYYTFGGTDIVERCLRLVPGSEFQTPLLGDQVPSAWSSVIPNWTFFWIVACREFAEHTGNRLFAAEILPSILATLSEYSKHLNADDLLDMMGWNLLDWAPIDQPDDGIVTHQNVMLKKALEEAAAIAEFAGVPEQGKECSELAARMKSAINRHLWSEERQAYLDCIHPGGRRSTIFSMQTQVMALLTGVAESDRYETLNGYLTATPEGFVPIGSPFMSFFYYETLMRSGNVQWMLDDIRANYGFMLDNDATTCWEMYGHTKMNRANENDLTRSHCHAWSAAPGYFLGAYVIGVRPAAPGWAKVIIEPMNGDLIWAKGTVPLPQGGCIDVAWKAEKGQISSLVVTAPELIELDIRVPAACTVNLRRVSRLPE
jgi:alpha-L-rhamnosidase